MLQSVGTFSALCLCSLFSELNPPGCWLESTLWDGCIQLPHWRQRIREWARCLKPSRRLFWGGLGPGPGSAASLPLPLASLKERAAQQSIGGPGLWDAADCCLMLALGWWFERLLKSVEMSETSAVSAWCPLPTFLFYVFLCVWALRSCLSHLPALWSRVGAT